MSRGPRKIIKGRSIQLLIVTMELNSLTGSESRVKDKESLNNSLPDHLDVAASDLAKVLGKEPPAAGCSVVQTLIDHAGCNSWTSVEDERNHSWSGILGIKVLQANQWKSELRGETIGDLQL